MRTPHEGKGYHTAKIPKGVFGEASKITEEYYEWLDALSQGVKILELVELADLIGAIEGYAAKQYSISLQDLIQMKSLTERAFIDGTRIVENKSIQDSVDDNSFHGELACLHLPGPPAPGFQVIWGDGQALLGAGNYWYGMPKYDMPKEIKEGWWFCTNPDQIMKQGYAYAIKNTK